MIVSFKGFVTGLKDSSVPLSEEDNKRMNKQRTIDHFEKLKIKWNEIIKEGK